MIRLANCFEPISGYARRMDELNEGANQALSSLVRYGVSDELIALIHAIEDTCDGAGNPLYEQASIYELRCSILCRNYGKTLWEYCHFAAVLEHLSPHGICDLFWLKEVTTGERLKHWFDQFESHSWLSVQANGAINAQLGKRVFSLNPKRVNLMVAWTAFISFIDPGLLGQLAQFNHDLSDERIDNLSKQLKLKLDQYLESHLQAVHQQRQGRILLTWLQGQEQANEQGAILSDSRVLAFWQQQAGLAEGDFKRFSTVAECAFRLYKAIMLGEQQSALNTAQSYDQDADGESAEWLLDTASLLDNEDGQWLFDALTEDHECKAIEQLKRTPLDKIKFLTNKDVGFCESIERAGSGVYKLPLTYQRSQIFGAQQARITEDLRKTKGKNVQSLSAIDDFSGAAIWIDMLEGQLSKLKITRTAIGHVLIHSHHPAGITKMIEYLPVDERADLLKGVKAGLIVSEADTGIGEVLGAEHMDNIKYLLSGPIKDAEKAYAKVNRTGFKTLPEQNNVEAFYLGDQCLEQLERMLCQYQASLIRATQQSGGLEQQEQLDRAVFSSVFLQLYCANGVTL